MIDFLGYILACDEHRHQPFPDIDCPTCRIIAPLLERIAALEKRVEKLEARKKKEKPA